MDQVHKAGLRLDTAPMQCVEYRDLVAAHVDEQLSPEELALALAHVAGCARCARELERQRAFKRSLRGRNLIHATPDALRRAVQARIDAQERAQPSQVWWSAWWSRPVARLALAGAVGLLLIAVAGPLLRSRSQPPAPAVFDRIVADYHAAESEHVELSVRTDDPMELREYYYKTGAFSFTNTVVDLEPLGFSLVGGAITELAGQKSTFSLYRGARGMILCHRIQAAGVELPPGGDVVGGDRFYTFGGITVCVHREGDVLCFMASAMARADFVRLFAGHV